MSTERPLRLDLLQANVHRGEVSQLWQSRTVCLLLFSSCNCPGAKWGGGGGMVEMSSLVYLCLYFGLSIHFSFYEWLSLKLQGTKMEFARTAVIKWGAGRWGGKEDHRHFCFRLLYP